MPEVNFLVKKGLTVPKGSAATPAVIFDASDSNTGIYSPGADQVAISTGGSGRLFVDASGRLGIGTSSPSYPLDVSGIIQAGNGFLISQNGGSAVRVGAAGQPDFNNPGSDLYFSVTAGQKFAWGNSANRTDMTLDSSGRLGIGTTSPAVNAHIFGSQAAFRIESSNTDARLQLTSSSGTWVVGNSVGGTGNYLSFYDVTASSERARIDSSGRLLVGTSSSSGAPSSGAVIQLADQFSVRAGNGGGITNRVATTASATTLNCVIDVAISGNIYSSFIGTLYICQQLTDSSKSFLAEYRVKIYNSGSTAVFTLVDSVDNSSPNNVALTFAYSNSNRQITATSTWTTATSSVITCTLVGAGANA